MPGNYYEERREYTRVYSTSVINFHIQNDTFVFLSLLWCRGDIKYTPSKREWQVNKDEALMEAGLA